MADDAAPTPDADLEREREIAGRMMLFLGAGVDWLTAAEWAESELPLHAALELLANDCPPNLIPQILE